MGKPTLMQSLNKQIAELSEVIKKAKSNLTVRFKETDIRIQKLEQNASLAKAWKAKWACLIELANLVQHYYKNAEQKLDVIMESKTLAVVHTRLDEIEDIYQEVILHFQRLQEMETQLTRNYAMANKQVEIAIELLNKAESMASKWICLGHPTLQLSQLVVLKKRELQQIGMVESFEKAIAALIEIINLNRIEEIYREISGWTSKLDGDLRLS